MRGFAVLALTFGSVSMATGSPAPQERALTIVVGDHTGIEASTLSKAVEVARRILSKANI